MTAERNVEARQRIEIPAALRDSRFRFIKCRKKKPAEYFWTCLNISDAVAAWEKKRESAQQALNKARKVYEEIKADPNHDPEKLKGAEKKLADAKAEAEKWENYPRPERLTNYQFDDPELLSWIEQGNNYGVMTGVGGLMVLDMDKPERLEELGIRERWPATFEVHSRPGRPHLYILCPDFNQKMVLDDPELKDDEGKPLHLGELQGLGAQVIGPGSIHPDSGKTYQVVKDVPFAEMTGEQVIGCLEGLKFQIDKDRPRNEGTGGTGKPAAAFDMQEYHHSPFRRLKIEEIGGPVPGGAIDTTFELGDEICGSHPIHDSTTGRNYSINPNTNLWRCWRCDSGGDVPLFLAMKYGLLDCRDCRSGALTKELFLKVWEMALEEGLDVDPMPEENDQSITFEEVTKEDENGKVRFSPTRAGEAVCQKMLLAMSRDEDQVYIYTGQIYEADGERQIDKALCQAAGDKVTANALKETMRRVKNQLLDNPVKFDPNPYMLGVKNGVVDLLTGEFRDYRPEDFITDMIPVIYDREAKCPQFLRFLESITPDVSDRLTLIDWLVATAIREPLPYVLFLLGLGRNGKGVFERVMKRFFGQGNFREMQLEEADRSNFARADFYRARGWIASETNGKRKGRLSTDFIKMVTGQGMIDSDRKYQGRIKFEPFFQTVVDTNVMPQIDDSSKGWQERFIKIDLPYIFVAEPDPKNPLQKKRDNQLYERLTTDEELSGILNMLIYRAQAIGKSRTIHKRPAKEMFEEYAVQSISVNSFLDMFCSYQLTSKSEVLADDLYDKYCTWCELQVAEMVSKSHFGRSVKRFCGDNDSTKTTRNGKNATIYKGLSFDEVAYKAAIERLRDRRAGTGNCRKLPQTAAKLTDFSEENGLQIPVTSSTAGNVWKKIKELFDIGVKPPRPHIGGMPEECREVLPNLQQLRQFQQQETHCSEVCGSFCGNYQQQATSSDKMEVAAVAAIPAVSGANQVSGPEDQPSNRATEHDSELSGDSIELDSDDYEKVLEKYTLNAYYVDLHVDLDDVVKDTGIYREIAREWPEEHCISRGCGMYEPKPSEVKEPKRLQEQKSKGNLEMLTPDKEEILIRVARRLAHERKPITGFTLAFEARSQGLEITPSLCEQWMESLPVNPSAPESEIDIEWLKDPMKYEYLRESIQVMTRNASGKFTPRLPRGSILVGYGKNQAQWQHGKLYTRRFWWVAAHDRDLEPKGVYREFSPSEAVIPASIVAGRSSLNYSAIICRKLGDLSKTDLPGNQMASA